jgi:hypothetical protein
MNDERVPKKAREQQGSPGRAGRPLLNYWERKHGKHRPRADNFVGNAQSRPRLDMGCSAVQEEEIKFF